MTDRDTHTRRGKLLIAAVATTLTLGSGIALRADTLVLRDGREVTGEVERIDGGYRVKTANGVVQVTRSDVAEWKRVTGPATAPPTTGTPAAPARIGTSATAPASATDKKARTIEVLVSHGGDALALGDFKAARDLLVDAIQLDPRNRPALESLGYCYLKLDDIQRATRSLEAAVAANPTPSRAVTLNLAYSLLRTRNPMRGAKMIKDYLAANSTSLDEEALNAYAICLGQSTDESRLNRFWTECVTFYDQYNTKLEATKPGQKRWGTDWIPQGEWAVTDGKNKAIQAQLDGKWRELQSAIKDFNKAKSAYEDAFAANRFKKNVGPSPSSLEPQVRSTKARADKLQTEYNDLSSRLIRPTLPKLFDPVPMDTGGAMLASAAGTGLSPGVGSQSPGLLPNPTPVTPPVTAQPKPPVTPSVTPPPSTPRPVDPPVAIAPPVTPQPTPVPTPTPRPESRKRAVFTSACGFAVGPDLIVTTASCVEGTTRITVQPADSDPIDADLVRVDAASGLALIRLKGRKMAYLPIGDAFAGGVLQCVSYPSVSIFDPISEVISGSSIPPKDDWTIRLNKHPRVGGAPILANGKVVGVCLASRDNDSTTLPSASLEKLKAFVGVLPPSPNVADPTVAVMLVNGVREK